MTVIQLLLGALAFLMFVLNSAYAIFMIGLVSKSALKSLRTRKPNEALMYLASVVGFAFIIAVDVRMISYMLKAL